MEINAQLFLFYAMVMIKIQGIVLIVFQATFCKMVNVFFQLFLIQTVLNIKVLIVLNVEKDFI
jgi:hypothetical protein